VTVVAIAGLAIPGLAGVAYADDPEPGISPESVDEMILPGYDFEVEKTVTTAAIPPTVEICLLEDETGSFGDDIGNLQNPATIQAIYDDITAGTSSAAFAVSGFRDYPVSTFGEPGDWVYRSYSTMSTAFLDWENGVNSLTAGGGLDAPEAQYDAIVGALNGFGEEPGCGFSSDADVARVLIVATDAPFHTPDGTHVNDSASTIAALTAADVAVLGLKAPGAGGELDALAAATGGAIQDLSSDGSNIAAAILAGLGNLPIEVEMTSDCAYPISTTFGPENPTTVTSGDTASFTETIAVAADAPGGVYTCTDYVWFNGEKQEFVETKTILVPENFVTGGGNITEGKGKNRVNHLSFGGNSGYMADGTILGHWSMNFHDAGVKVNTTEITRLQFLDTGLDPAPPLADADTAQVWGTARVDFGDGWEDGCDFYAAFQDGGEPQEDYVRAFVSCPSGSEFEFGDLSGGNIQIHDGTKG